VCKQASADRKGRGRREEGREEGREGGRREGGERESGPVYVFSSAMHDLGVLEQEQRQALSINIFTFVLVNQVIRAPEEAAARA
jgi:hypothetical protein